MKVFLVTRACDYDEYEAAILVAESMEQATEIIKNKKLPNGDPIEYEDRQDSRIEEISLDKPKEIYAFFSLGWI